MIIEHEGNIFLAPVDIIIHQCNCFHTMGSGIAKTISEMFPEVYKTDCEKTIKGDITKLGSYNFTKVSYHLNPQLKYIMNLYGQYKYGGDRRYTSYDALAEGFASINEGANKREKIPVLAVPYKLGSARAGGSWQVVRAILDDTFGDSKVPLYICKFEV
jgi:O-acetyl-ADP-ribose deacetylase (regulator of RNase III)